MKNAIQMFRNEKCTIYKCYTEKPPVIDYWVVFDAVGNRMATIYDKVILQMVVDQLQAVAE